MKKVNRVLWLSLLIFVFVVTWPSAQSQTSENEEQRIEKLERMLEQQGLQIETLQKRLQEKKQDTSPKSEQDAAVVDEYLEHPATQDDIIAAGYEKGRGFFIRNTNRDLELVLSGFAQIGIAVFENNSPDNNSVYPNGVSLMNDVYFFQQWHARIEVNFANLPGGSTFQNQNFGNVALRDAFIEYTGIPELNIRIGQTHVPFTIEGQYNENQGLNIWGEPYIGSWGHFRDPGVMITGTIRDVFEYKLSVHNGDGQNNLNGTDDFLMGLGSRIYFLKKSENPNTFFHIGFIRSRDDRGVNFAGDINAASLRTPWGRTVFGTSGNNTLGLPPTNDDSATQGWKTGIDVGIRYERAFGEVNYLRTEMEFLYMYWQRDFSDINNGARLPYLEGFGVTGGFNFRHNLLPDVPGAGVFGIFKFSYSDIDNDESNSVVVSALGNGSVANANIIGQRVYSYTFGLGYAFNDFLAVQVNWLFVQLDEHDLYNTVGGNGAKITEAGDALTSTSNGLEHGWFLQITAQW